MADDGTGAIFSIGYGNRDLGDFTGLLLAHSIAFVIDVRSHPYSSHRPEFSRGSLNRHLRAVGIRYVFMGDSLGGQPDDESCYSNGKVDYRLLKGKPYYRQGTARLRKAWGDQQRIALMCSESKPEECHRSKLIGETLDREHIPLSHIDENGDLLTQEQVILRLTAGQMDLLGPSFRAFTSRKRYRDKA